jgi:hypothetical protein
MTSKNRYITNHESNTTKIKKNVGWLGSALAIIALLFTSGMRLEKIIDDAEIHEINAKHYSEIVTLKQKYFYEIKQLEYENHELRTLKLSGKEGLYE